MTEKKTPSLTKIRIDANINAGIRRAMRAIGEDTRTIKARKAVLELTRDPNARIDADLYLGETKARCAPLGHRSVLVKITHYLEKGQYLLPEKVLLLDPLEDILKEIRSNQ